MKHQSLKPTLLVALVVLLGAPVVQATPYATAVTNTGSSVSFRLNEAADSVKIISAGGAVTNDLGALPAGLNTVSLAVTGPFQIEVNKGPTFGYLQGVANQISSDANRLVRFNAPRGVAVNRNPASAYFGRIYISNADTGSVAAVTRNLLNGDGIFMLNADFTDAVGQGDTARTAGLNWRNPPVTDHANKPFRIEVGEDSNLYISDYTSFTNATPTGNLYVADPDVADTSGTNVFVLDPANAGRIPSSAVVKGSLGAGNLTVYAIYPDKLYNYDFLGFPASSYSVMQRWDVGSGPLPSGAVPVRVTDLPILVSDVPSVLSDIEVAPDGKYFITQNRSAGFEGGLFVVDPAKDTDASGYPDIVFDSLAYSVAYFGMTNDLLLQTRGVKVAPDGSVVALVRDDNRVWIIPLTNGIPDLSRRLLMDSGVLTTLGRDITFDAAGNLYTASSGQAAIKAFSPGFASRAVTGSDGTFSVTRLTNSPPLVYVTASDTNIYEATAGDTGIFTVFRLGDTAAPLDVDLSLGGTALNGGDYQLLSTLVTIPTGQIRVTNVVYPINNPLLDGNRTLVVSVLPGPNYEVNPTNNSATIQIRDDDQPPGPVLFSDDFDTDTSANYAVVFGAENGVDDKTVLFSYDYSADNIPSAPHSVDGTNRGLKLTVNKNNTVASAAGVNIYPLGLSLSNEFALRFDMYERFSSAAAGTTEHSIFGLNHSGSRTNRALTGGGLVGGDGLWFAVESDGSASSSARSYALFASTNPAVAPPFSAVSARTMDPFFTAPPFLANGAPSGQWVDVEVTQTNLSGNLIITWKINAVVILVRTNTTPYTSGTIMLGHMDSFNSIGSTSNYTIFDNVRVINLTTTRPNITSIRRADANVEIDFTAGADDAADAFTLESSTGLPDGFDPDAGASITALGGGQFRAVSPNSAGPQRFFRIKR
ncbi:MAG: hypothetical protein HZA90_00890 [Verrucomicrobia bacterium]|nr:hypothetical protein [Verrucomicrobiota bacterium]